MIFVFIICSFGYSNVLLWDTLDMFPLKVCYVRQLIPPPLPVYVSTHSKCVFGHLLFLFKKRKQTVIKTWAEKWLIGVVYDCSLVGIVDLYAVVVGVDRRSCVVVIGLDEIPLIVGAAVPAQRA